MVNSVGSGNITSVRTSNRVQPGGVNEKDRRNNLENERYHQSNCPRLTSCTIVELTEELERGDSKNDCRNNETDSEDHAVFKRIVAMVIGEEAC